MRKGRDALGASRAREVAGTRRRMRPPQRPDETSSGTPGTRKAVMGGIGVVLSALLIAWLTPVGPWLWAKVFPPPTINVSVAFLYEGCGSHVVPNPARTSIEDPKFGTPTWQVEHRAAHSDPTLPGRGTSRIILTVSGETKDHPVIITGLSFNALEQESSPLAGEVMDIPCGGQIEARYAQVDLDSMPPTIVRSSDEAIVWDPDLPIRATPLQFPYEVTNEETEVLHLVAYTRGYVEWTIDLAWSDGRSSGHEVIDNHGSPFRTSVSPTEYTAADLD